MPKPSLQGIVPALVTPFREDELIDYDAWQAIIDALIGAGVDGLFVGGSSGEFCSLEMDERRVSMRFCRQAVRGRVPLYGNVGCVTTRDTVKLARHAEEVGVDVVVVVTPYYLRPSPQELAEHYIEVCQAVRLPVLGYNFPQHGGVGICPETVAQVGARCENLAGMKDSSGRLELALAYRNCVPGRELAVFVGPEKLILPALEQGCAGAVTGCANFAPRLLVALYQAFREGNRAEAGRLDALAGELDEVSGLHTFPSVIKEAMKMLGLPAGVCRRPVGTMPPNARQKLAAVLSRAGMGAHLGSACPAPK
ncbi:MAG: dihydrodipicolinate synthase family protein [Acidobacteriia bacterium]|nr:dihydrodipicolinate synthase family protein [Terriglobia bacterium]